MKNLYFVFVFCLLTPLIALAQSNYRPGYIVKSNGDTLKGYINYREWNRSPKFIEFKPNTTDRQPVVFYAGSAKGFHVNGLDDYLSYTGPVSTGRVNAISDLPHSLDTSVRQDTAFLRIISKGVNVQLLYHADKVKRRYFISEGNAKPYELNFYQYMDYNDRVISSAPFMDQIDLLLRKYNNSSISARDRVSEGSYTGDVLIRYVNTINHNNNTIERSGTSGSRFFAGAAVAYNLSVFNGPANFGYESTSSSISPSIDFGVDIFSNRYIQKTLFRIEVSLVAVSPNFNSNVGYYTSKQYIATVTPQMIVNLYNTEKMKYYIGAGLGVAFNSTSGSKLVATTSGVILTPVALQNKGESYVSLQAGQSIANPYNSGSIDVNIQLKTGLIINNKEEIFLGVIPYAVGASDSGYNYKNLRASLGFNYLFGSK